MNNSILDKYSNVEYVETVEYNGKYVVALMTEPFFALSEKNKFKEDVSTFLNEKFGIAKSDVIVTFDLSIIHLIKKAKCREDIKYIIDKAFNL